MKNQWCQKNKWWLFYDARKIKPTWKKGEKIKRTIQQGTRVTL